MSTKNEWRAPIVRQLALEAGSIEYREYGAVDSAPILFVHGVLSNYQLWEHVAEHLSFGYRCIVPAWPLGAHSVSMK